MDNKTLRLYPASLRVTETLRERIQQSRYRAGTWLPAERDLADEFAVSRPIIRAALSRLIDEGLIIRPPGCRPRIASRASGLASPVERSPAVADTTQTIAVVLPQQPTYVSAHAILRGVGQTLQQKEAPYRLSVFDTHAPLLPSDGSPLAGSSEKTALERIEREGIAGIILWHLDGAETLPNLRRLQEHGTALVFIDRYPDGLDADYVGVDNRSGVCAAVEYLLDLGHRRIAYLTNEDMVTTARERLDGYREALQARGIPPDPELLYVNPGDLREDMSRAVDHFRAMEQPPTALVALNDRFAFAFIREARERGWRVPEDISVMGFDDIECYSPHPATLTTVHQPFAQIGQRAAELLLRRLQSPPSLDKRTYWHLMLCTSLTVRATCRPNPPSGK